MFNSLPPATRTIIAANVIIFLLQLAIGAPMEQLFALWPLHTNFEPWQLVSYAFLHARSFYLHLFFNMFAVYMFGAALEYYWGSRRFLVYYFACVIAAAATQLAASALSHSGSPVIGASGAVFGLLFAFAVNFPRQKLLLLFPPIPMPAWLFVTLYGALELLLGVTNWQPDVAHFAHLGGLLGGALVILYWRARKIAP
ncbi:MAG TPA: rhomboid family intramembrane serine protease [Steroidobacteraceae bacterium]